VSPSTDGRQRRARRSGRQRGVVVRSLIAAAMLVLATGCSKDDVPRFAMPTPITAEGHRILSLWQGSWIAALFVGVIVWGLIIWCVIVYRKRDESAAPQLAFNLPIEILYTIVPVIFVGVFFYFTARDETAIDKLSPNPDVTVEVVGFQWDWQFNYLSSANDATATTLASITGDNAHGSPATLELPAGESVRFKLVSPDVIHAFWVPAFLFKRDVIPGRTNEFEVHIDADKAGNTYKGRCTEFCGLNHDQMIFHVKLVTPATFNADMVKMEDAFKSGSTT
jgi:cytochrome c oxidase subunit 2